MGELTEIVSALLVPIIAIVTTYVAVQQYRIARQKIRYELYPARLKIFKTIDDLLTEIVLRGPKVNPDRVINFLHDTSEAEFLLDGNVKKRVESIFNMSIQLLGWLEDYKSASNEEKEQILKRISVHLGWFEREQKILRSHFRKYLRIRS